LLCTSFVLPFQVPLLKWHSHALQITVQLLTTATYNYVRTE
jgi:hypothetical protein